jgi:hypothetical protein
VRARATTPLAIAAAATTAACGARTTTTPTDPPNDLPAVTWSTPLPPYRLPGRPSQILVDDRRLVAVQSSGAITAVELATGATTSRTTPIDGDLVAAFRGADGAAVVAVEKDEHLAFYAVGDDLALALIREDPDPGWTRTSIAVAPDGRLAMSGASRPLIVYDADGNPGPALGGGAVGWSGLAFADGGKRLLGEHAGELHSFELATGAQLTVGLDGEVVSAGDGPKVLALVANALVLLDVTTLISPEELANPGKASAAMSRDGTQVARLDETSVMIHDTASRRIVARYALGASYSSLGDIAFTPRGDRVVIVSGAVVRVLDVASGALTDAGPGPYDYATFLRFTRDRLIAHDDRIYSWPINGGAATTIGPDEPAGGDGALSPSAEWVVISRSLPRIDPNAPISVEVTTWPLSGDGAPRARYKRMDTVSSIAVEDSGDILVGAWRSSENDQPGHNVIDAGDEAGNWRQLIEVHYDGYVDAIDAATRLAAISSGGAVRVIELPGTAAIASASIPTCDSGGAVNLDAAGRRLATDDDKTLWIWSFAERPTRKVGAAGLRGKIGDVEFVPGRTEVVIDLDERIAIWDYTGGPVRSTPVEGVVGRLAIDAAGTRVAATQSNGRIHVFSLADLRKGSPEETNEPAADQRCERDPLEPPGDRRPIRPTWVPSP